MVRAAGTAVAGYLIVFVATFGLMTLAWLAVGVDGAFKPGLWAVTPGWLVLMLLASFLAAIAGGYATARISPDPRAVKLLVGILIVLGIVFAMPTLSEPTGMSAMPRPSVLPMLDAMQNGRPPVWAAFLSPLIGAAGVLLGVRPRRGRP